MAVRNPYERRHQHDDANPGQEAMMATPFRGMRPVFEMQELEAVVQSAFQRGREHEDEIAQEHEQQSCLVAFDNGYANGAVAGRTAVLEIIEQTFGPSVRQVIGDTQQVLNAYAEGDKKITKDVLESHLQSCLLVLGHLEQSRSNGFDPLPW